MRARDSYSASNISATTSAFTLAGGLYGIDYAATWGGGSVTLQKLAGDGSTYVTVQLADGFDAIWSSNGFDLAQLPPGTYKLAVATATAVYVQINRIPGE